jgi:hypothetical protein
MLNIITFEAYNIQSIIFYIVKRTKYDEDQNNTEVRY